MFSSHGTHEDSIESEKFVMGLVRLQEVLLRERAAQADVLRPVVAVHSDVPGVGPDPCLHRDAGLACPLSVLQLVLEWDELVSS